MAQFVTESCVSFSAGKTLVRVIAGTSRGRHHGASTHPWPQDWRPRPHRRGRKAGTRRNENLLLLHPLLLLLLLAKLLLPHGHRLRLPWHPDHCARALRRLCRLGLARGLHGRLVRLVRLPAPCHVSSDPRQDVPDGLRAELALLQGCVNVVQPRLRRPQLLLLAEQLFPGRLSNLVKDQKAMCQDSVFTGAFFLPNSPFPTPAAS